MVLRNKEERKKERKKVGNKLEIQKVGFVQTLREKTLKSDCKRGNQYRHF